MKVDNLAGGTGLRLSISLNNLTMKRIILLLLMLLPLVAMPQSRESDECFNKAQELLKAQKYEEALKLYEKSYAIDRANKGDTLRSQYQMIDCISQLTNYYETQKRYSDAIRVGKKEYVILKNLLGKNSQTCAIYELILAKFYAADKQYAEAIKLTAEAANILKVDTEAESDEYYGKALEQLMSYYGSEGKYSDAIRVGNQCLELQKKKHGENTLEYAILLDNIASCHSMVGELTEALRLQNSAVQIVRRTAGENSREYAKVLSTLAARYHRIGDYESGVKYGTQAAEITKRLYGDDKPEYASALNNLAACYDAAGNHDEAIRLATKVVDIRRKTLGESHPDYIMALNNLSSYYTEAGRNDEAEALGKQSMSASKDAIGEENSQYAILLTNNAMQYFYAGNYDEALNLATKAVDILKRELGESHPDYASALGNLAAVCFAAGRYDDATKAIKKIYDNDYEFVRKNFAVMSYKERANFWKKFSALYNIYLPHYACKNPVPELTKLAYNGQVLSKGMLLNTELELKKIIDKKANKDLTARYNKVMDLRTALDKLYATPADQRTTDPETLLTAIENEEIKLMEGCQELGDYTKNISITWSDVQQKLVYGDIAIEFAYCYDMIEKSGYYAAIVIKKGMYAPEIVRLFDESIFISLDVEDLHGQTLYDVIWKPLDKYLQGVKDVYFSPCGILHALCIEYLPDDDGKLFSEKYNAYRMSSTRELAVVRPANTNRKAATFGGITYNGKYGDVPGGASYVSTTKDESDAVAQLLRNAKYTVTALSGAAATEESFKNLSGSGIKILHISTHGFYIPESDNAPSDQKSKEEQSMNNSGLLFAGANDAEVNRLFEIAESGDDGILTATEISRLDFRGLDLVVLSACESGLGEITGEGVFGLQRGFKKAGAKTIIMTLWSVSGEVSSLLMSEFFKNLTSGKNKRAAFLAAQKVVREKYPEPLLWAAFVMVDGTQNY